MALCFTPHVNVLVKVIDKYNSPEVATCFDKCNSRSEDRVICTPVLISSSSKE